MYNQFCFQYFDHTHFTGSLQCHPLPHIYEPGNPPISVHSTLHILCAPSRASVFREKSVHSYTLTQTHTCTHSRTHTSAYRLIRANKAPAHLTPVCFMRVVRARRRGATKLSPVCTQPAAIACVRLYRLLHAFRVPYLNRCFAFVHRIWCTNIHTHTHY